MNGINKLKRMNLESTQVSVAKSAKEVFEFLSNLENFEQLMPENTQKFEVDGDSFIFGLKGMPEIRLVLKEKTPYNNITLGAASSKLDFYLIADIEEVDASTSEVQLNFEGKFNMMMQMMVKKPLNAFIETLTENLQTV